MTVLHPAVATIAAREWRRRRWSVLGWGLLIAVVGGMLTGGAMLTARTASAPQRLLDAVDPGDARVLVFGGEQLADEIVALDGVAEHASIRVMVGQLDGPEVRYVAMAAVPSGDLLRPVVVDGRRPDPSVADEAMISEQLASAAGLGVGDVLSIALLTAEEVTQFDTGFGQPDGATVELTVVGVARTPPGVLDSSPVLVAPTLTSDHPESVAGLDLAVRLEDGAEGLGAFRAAVAALAAEAAPTAASDEFLPAIVEDPAAGTRRLERSSRVLVGGLTLAVLLGSLAALFALGQAMARQHAATVPAQRVERALGLPSRHRAIARALPWAGAAVVAGIGTAIVAVTAGGLEPAGPLRAVEPDPGSRVDVLIVVLGAGAVASGVLAIAAATAWWAGRPPAHEPGGRAGTAGLPPFAPRRRGWTLAGAAFAWSGSGRGATRTRASLAGAIVGVTGVVAGLSFAATLERLVTTPARYGWTTDLAIADVRDDLVAELAGDPRFAAVSDVRSGSIEVDGRILQAYSYVPVRGMAGWVLLDGRTPQWSGEVALGTKAADQLEAEIGDRVAITGLGAVEVVGIGIGAPLTGEPFGEAVLLDPDALADGGGAALDNVFRELVLRVAPGEDREGVIRDLAGRYEVIARELPREIQDLADLGRLPELLGGFIAVLGALAVAHGIVVTARRRAPDVAVLRALGATPRQAGLAVVAMSVTTAVVGLAVGLPMGWAAARVVWSLLAQSVGVEPGVVVPASIGLVVIVTVLAAVLVALLPARRIARLEPASLLRSE